MIEKALRESLAARVATPPALDDPAGRAIRRGQARLRRRRAASGAAALVLFSGLLSGAVAGRRAWLLEQAGERGGPPAAAARVDEPAPPPVVDVTPFATGTGGAATSRAPVGGSASRLRTAVEPDVRVGNAVFTAGGERIDLGGSAPVTAVYRVPAGLVYLGDGLRLQRTHTQSVFLTGRPDGWALSPDGTRLAYAADEYLTVGDLTDRGLTVRVAVPIDRGVTPVAFAGDKLVLARGGQFDFMNVDGGYSPTWSRDVLAVYGARSGRLAGLVRSGESACLAELSFKPAGLAVERVGTCRFKLTAGLGARLSPDGRWLAVPGVAGVSLVDLDAAFAAGRAVDRAKGSTTKVIIACPGLADPPPAWLSGSTLATANAKGPLRCRTDGGSQAAALPTGAGTGWSYVPRLSGT